MAISSVNFGYIRCELLLYLVSFLGKRFTQRANTYNTTNIYSGLCNPVIPVHRVFQWWRLQRLVGPQDRYGEQSEPALKLVSSAVRDAFSYVEVHFHSPTLSSALSNMGTIGSTGQEMWRMLEENATIEKRSRSSTRTVHGKRRALCLHCQEMTPNHLATGYKLEHTN